MAQNSISKGASKTDFGKHNRPISTQKVSKSDLVKIQVLNGAMILINGLCQNNWFLE